jgi:plasmid replication initiation protein
MSVNEKNEILVVQSKDLNDAFYKENYTILEKKLILQLISEIDYYNEDDTDLQEIDVREFDFLKDLVKDNNHVYIHHNVCRSIKAKTLQINGMWHSWFYSIGCQNGKIYYEFDKDVKKHLIKQEGILYNKFFLKNILNLDNYYSIRIYEILSLMVNWKNNTQIFHRRISWKDFKKFLNLDDKNCGYRPYDIKTKIIEKVKKDLEKKTDIKFNYTINKKGKFYDSIDFVIMKNKEN